MDENGPGKEATEEKTPVEMIVERRRQRQTELSSEDVMRILRRRAEKAARKVINVEPTDSDTAG